MRVKYDDLQLCDDCMIVAVNGDYSGLDYQMNGRGPEAEAKRDARIAEVDAGLSRLGSNLVPHFDSETGDGCNEFSSVRCDCCNTRLAGSRHRFAVLETDNA